MIVDDEKIILKNELGKLIGFEGGEEDVLAYLLSIESAQDLSEYIVQLLGVSQEVTKFIEMVSRYKKGEPVGEKESKNASIEKNELEQNELLKAPKYAAATASRRNCKQQNQEEKPKIHPSKKTNTKKCPPQSNPSSRPRCNVLQNQKRSSNIAVTQQSQHKELRVRKSHPSRGKAKIVCGCFGTKHKPLTNCLYCGRISCAAEGYDYCPFCGLMVETVIDGIDTKAWIQKERLLRFDREFAR